ncbi:hypothetical protein HUW46_09064 [Amycolatopsis sp. CA-230715]|nr:DUF6884 domain-containing protein [Amycolatopsis sp. CA-230715]QWF85609.1 hypothetical protein HUW46_09064 [Amycolatopsis sp. CA-230715]
MLYSSLHFQYTLRQIETAASAEKARVRILSALHGLIEADAMLAPYDMSMASADSVNPANLATQLYDLTGVGQHLEIRAFLPSAYLERLHAAAHRVRQEKLIATTVYNFYANTRGIGHQRHVLAGLNASR